MNRTPQPDPTAVLKLPEPPAADYCDELSKVQMDTLRQEWNQDETQMGAVVHEFRW